MYTEEYYENIFIFPIWENMSEKYKRTKGLMFLLLFGDIFLLKILAFFKKKIHSHKKKTSKEIQIFGKELLGEHYCYSKVKVIIHEEAVFITRIFHIISKSKICTWTYKKKSYYMNFKLHF